MKTLTIIAILTTLILAGCNDGKINSAEDSPLPATNAVQSRIVTKASLISALWAEGEDEDPEAKCLVGSTFSFDETTGFMIKRRMGQPTETNVTPVVIVSPINVVIPDQSEDRRGEGCEAGELKFIVTASEDVPLDIEISKEAPVRHSLEAKARIKPTPYPDRCRITVHFEKHGIDVCKMEAVAETPPTEPPPAEDGAATTPPPDDGANPEPDGAGASSAPEENVCEKPPSHTLKLVVDAYECT